MQYPILKENVIFEEEIKKSRFITYLQKVENIAEAKAFWQALRSEHHSARHHCWATVAGTPQDSQQYGFSDDGEPAGTAGKPMLSALLGSGIGGICAVVVRYYGGIQLGTGGLVRAYGNGVQQALKLAETEIKIERTPYLLYCHYDQLNWVQQLLQQQEVVIYQQQFSDRIELQLGVAEEKLASLVQQLNDRSSGQLQLIKV